MSARQLLVIALVTGCQARGAPARDVMTTQGVVRGYLVDHPETSYYAYRAIVYARATQNRFKAPKASRRWDGTFEATYQVKCPQPDGSGTEECLVVNVFSPEHASNLPVLVVVHGGDFQTGWGAYQPPARLLSQNLVIVTFNYRLGALGFLCLASPEAPGNAGLKDQVLALYWVQKNIEKFGGNPFDVTIYGIGSGASSVQLLQLSGASQGLFHKAILESGSALSPLSLSYDPLSTAFDAATEMGYTGEENSRDLAQFYNKISLKTLVNVSTLFLPCLENRLEETHSLLEEDPMEIYQQRLYHTVPMIIAYTNMPGATKTEANILNANLPNSFDTLLPVNLEFANENTRHRLAEIVKDFYLGGHPLVEDLLQNYIEYFNDVTYEYPIIKSAVLHAATSPLPTYLMRFTPRDRVKRSPRESIICCKSIFDYFYAKDLDSDDHTIAESLVTLWSNFIKIGDPTPLTTHQVPVLWQPVKAGGDTLDIKSVTGLILGPNLQMNNQLAHKRILFWDQIYRKFYRINTVSEDLEII